MLIAKSFKSWHKGKFKLRSYEVYENWVYKRNPTIEIGKTYLHIMSDRLQCVKIIKLNQNTCVMKVMGEIANYDAPSITTLHLITHHTTDGISTQITLEDFNKYAPGLHSYDKYSRIKKPNALESWLNYMYQEDFEETKLSRFVWTMESF